MRFAAGLALLMATFGACSGRYVETGTDNTTAGSSNRGGTRSFSGSASTGATTNSGTTGSVGVGGATGYAGAGIGFAGSAATGGACACDASACPPGFRPVPDPNGCCFYCESICNVACPEIGCGPGSHLETRPGQCCPVCVVDDCNQQRSLYQDFKKQLVDKYSSFGCMTANDCTMYYEKNQCEAGCGIVMPIAGIAFLDDNLQNYAQQNCSANCSISVPPCAPLPPPRCLNNRCQ